MTDDPTFVLREAKRIDHNLDVVGAPAPTINHILTERNKTHGDFTVNSGISQAIKQVMEGTSGSKWNQLTNSQKEALQMIAHKIGRILAGDPNHHDHWTDIAGYAKLAADRCPLAKD